MKAVALLVLVLAAACFAEEMVKAPRWGKTPRPWGKTPGSSLDPKCKLCVDAITAAEAAIGKANLTTVIDQVCAKAKMTAICKAVLEKKLPSLLPFLKAKVSPMKICSMKNISMCKNTTETVEVEKREVEEVEIDIKCEACAAVLTLVKAQVSGKVTTDIIQRALDQVCGKIPFAKDICTMILSAKIQQIVDGFNQQSDPKTICKAVKVCK